MLNRLMLQGVLLKWKTNKTLRDFAKDERGMTMLEMVIIAAIIVIIAAVLIKWVNTATEEGGAVDSTLKNVETVLKGEIPEKK